MRRRGNKNRPEAGAFPWKQGVPYDPLDLVDKPALAAALKITIRGLNKQIARGDVLRPFTVGRHGYWFKPLLAAYFAAHGRTDPFRSPPARRRGRASP